jgi:electron transfer flavoprotein beta subunit
MSPLQMVVCLKQVPDPEGPADAFQVDAQAKRVIPVGIPPVINPYDENALEAALRLREEHGGRVTALSMGDKLAQPVLRKALAAGADDLILLTDPRYRDLDSRSTAAVLSKAIIQAGPFDLILTGRQGADWDFGITGLFLAEILQIPVVHLAKKIELCDEGIQVERLCEDGYEIVRVGLPALVTVSSEIGELRYVPVRALQMVSKKPLKLYKAEDIGIDPQELRARQVVDLAAVQNRRKCKFIEGESPQEKGENLALAMRADGIL